MKVLDKSEVKLRNFRDNGRAVTAIRAARSTASGTDTGSCDNHKYDAETRAALMLLAKHG